MIEHMVNGDYVVFQDEAMVNIDKLNIHSLTFYDIIDKYADLDVNVYINTAVLILMLITIFYRKKILENCNKVQKTLFFSIIIFSIVALIMTNKLINWESIPKFLWNIQFPWRLCCFLTFGTSIIASLAIKLFKTEESKRIIFIIVAIICLIEVNYTINESTLQVVEQLSYEEMSSVDSAKPMGNQKEYLPVNAKNNLEYLRDRSQDVIVMQGNANIEITYNRTPSLQFNIDIENDESVIVEIPRIFYFGYTIKLETNTGEVENIEYYENENGLIEFEIEKSGTIIIDYTGTVINRVANVISIFLVIIFVLYVIIYTISRRKSKKKEIF